MIYLLVLLFLFSCSATNHSEEKERGYRFGGLESIGPTFSDIAEANGILFVLDGDGNVFYRKEGVWKRLENDSVKKFSDMSISDQLQIFCENETGRIYSFGSDDSLHLYYDSQKMGYDCKAPIQTDAGILTDFTGWVKYGRTEWEMQLIQNGVGIKAEKDLEKEKIGSLKSELIGDTVWMMTYDDWFYLFDTNTKSWSHFKPDSLLRLPRSILQVEDELWIGTLTRGVFKLNRSTELTSLNSCPNEEYVGGVDVPKMVLALNHFGNYKMAAGTLGPTGGIPVIWSPAHKGWVSVFRDSICKDRSEGPYCLERGMSTDMVVLEDTLWVSTDNSVMYLPLEDIDWAFANDTLVADTLVRPPHCAPLEK